MNEEIQAVLDDEIFNDEKMVNILKDSFPVLELIGSYSDNQERITSKEIIIMQYEKDNGEGTSKEIDIKKMKGFQANLRSTRLKFLEGKGLIKYVKAEGRKGNERPMQLTGLGWDFVQSKDEVLKIIEEKYLPFALQLNLTYRKSHVKSIMNLISSIIDELESINPMPGNEYMDLGYNLLQYQEKGTSFNFKNHALYDDLGFHLCKPDDNTITFKELEKGLQVISKSVRDRVSINEVILELITKQIENVLNLHFSEGCIDYPSYSSHLISWIFNGLEYRFNDNLISHLDHYVDINFSSILYKINDENISTLIRFTGSPMIRIEGDVEEEMIKSNYIDRIKEFITSNPPYVKEYENMMACEENIYLTKDKLITGLRKAMELNFIEDDCCYMKK